MGREDIQEKDTRQKKIRLVKLKWIDDEHDISRELEVDTHMQYPHLFESS